MKKTTLQCNHWVLGSFRDHANAMWAARYVGVVRKLHQQEKEEEEEVFILTVYWLNSLTWSWMLRSENAALRSSGLLLFFYEVIRNFFPVKIDKIIKCCSSSFVDKKFWMKIKHREKSIINLFIFWVHKYMIVTVFFLYAMACFKINNNRKMRLMLLLVVLNL